MNKNEEFVGKTMVCSIILLFVTSFLAVNGWITKSVPNFLCYAVYSTMWIEAFRTNKCFESWFKVSIPMFFFSLGSTASGAVWSAYMMTGLFLGMISATYSKCR